tara:strand:- start:7843 stop:8025 length:183 start_codon:yes stop_codon:yes gene_type:complete
MQKIRLRFWVLRMAGRCLRLAEVNFGVKQMATKKKSVQKALKPNSGAAAKAKHAKKQKRR